ncbi:MAG: ABC transporter permease [Betaproteobacteria bacterium]|nr:ABC transporter permease [Betaproteobacteria bacterium]
MKSWFAQHLHSLKIAGQRFRDTPLATVFTMLVIGVAVALPAAFYVLLGNLERVSGGIKPQAEITVFLKNGVSETQGRALLASLSRNPDVNNARFVAKTEGVRRLEASGLAEIAAGLPENPLPHAFILTPQVQDAAALEKLGSLLRNMAETDRVLMDSDWIKRLGALMNLGHELVLMLAVILGLALAAITANTIRLQIYAQKDEIEVARLIGATDRFIRRPFLYFGGIQGLAGGLAGWLLVTLGGWLVQGSVNRVAVAYGAHFELTGLDLASSLLLLAVSALLGWLGAFFAVGQTLRDVETF